MLHTIGTFRDLQMTPDDFAAHKRRLGTQHSLSAASCSTPSRAKLRVTGYGSEVAAVIRTSCGEDTLVVDWRSHDSTSDVMSRIEQRLRIPMRYWRLGTNGGLLDPRDGDPLVWYAPFKGNNFVDLALIPVEEIEDYVTMYAARSLHPIWKRLRPTENVEKLSSSLEEARSLYHLIEPTRDGEWERYVILRKVAEADFFGTLRATEHLLKLHPMMMQIRDAVSFILEDTNLEHTQRCALADGVVPLTLNVQRSRYVTDAEVYSRIHSPTKPAAVDVSFLYRHRTHQNHVEFYCHVFFKILDPITSAKHDRPTLQSRNWERLFETGTYSDSDEHPPRRGWHPIVQTKWGLEASHIDRIRSALFGEEGRCPASAVDKVNTVRLLLASVGIPYCVGRTDEEADAQPPEIAKAVLWEWGYDNWIGPNIRRTCGQPLKRDGSWKRLSFRVPEDEDMDELNDTALEKWFISKQYGYKNEDNASLSSCENGNNSDLSCSSGASVIDRDFTSD